MEPRLRTHYQAHGTVGVSFRVCIRAYNATRHPPLWLRRNKVTSFVTGSFHGSRLLRMGLCSRGPHCPCAVSPLCLTNVVALAYPTQKRAPMQFSMDPTLVALHTRHGFRSIIIGGYIYCNNPIPHLPPPTTATFVLHHIRYHASGQPTDQKGIVSAGQPFLLSSAHRSSQSQCCLGLNFSRDRFAYVRDVQSPERP